VTALREKYFNEAEVNAAMTLNAGNQMKSMRFMPKHGNPLVLIAFLLCW